MSCDLEHETGTLLLLKQAQPRLVVHLPDLAKIQSYAIYNTVNTTILASCSNSYDTFMLTRNDVGYAPHLHFVRAELCDNTSPTMHEECI